MDRDVAHSYVVLIPRNAPQLNMQCNSMMNTSSTQATNETLKTWMHLKHRITQSSQSQNGICICFICMTTIITLIRCTHTQTQTHTHNDQFRYQCIAHIVRHHHLFLSQQRINNFKCKHLSIDRLLSEKDNSKSILFVLLFHSFSFQLFAWMLFSVWFHGKWKMCVRAVSICVCVCLSIWWWLDTLIDTLIYICISRISSVCTQIHFLLVFYRFHIRFFLSLVYSLATLSIVCLCSAFCSFCA